MSTRTYLGLTGVIADIGATGRIRFAEDGPDTLRVEIDGSYLTHIKPIELEYLLGRLPTKLAGKLDRDTFAQVVRAMVAAFEQGAAYGESY